LNSPITVRLAKVDHRLDGTITGDRIGEKAPQARLLKPFVGEQRHHLHVMRFGESHHAAIE